MHLRVVRSDGLWKIYAVAGDRVDPADPSEFECELLNVLEGYRADARYGHSVAKFEAQLDAIENDSRGPACLRDACHHICSQTVDGREVTIWQITAKDLRVMFFYDAGRIIICTNVFPKQGAKTPRDQQERAKRVCGQYFEKVRRK